MECSYSSVPLIPFLEFFIIWLYLDGFRECRNGRCYGSEAVRRRRTEEVPEAILPMVKKTMEWNQHMHFRYYNNDRQRHDGKGWKGRNDHQVERK